MKNILIILAVLMLFACGDPGSGRSNRGGDISIDCLTVSNSELEQCNDSEITALDVSFVVGDVSINQPAFGNFTVSNMTPDDFNGWYVVPLFVNGCGGMGFITKEVSIPSGESIGEIFGGLMCNALEGYQEYTITLYEGIMPEAPIWNDMWDGSCCNNTWDWSVLDNVYPIKARATVSYNYVY